MYRRRSGHMNHAKTATQSLLLQFLSFQLLGRLPYDLMGIKTKKAVIACLMWPERVMYVTAILWLLKPKQHNRKNLLFAACWHSLCACLFSNVLRVTLKKETTTKIRRLRKDRTYTTEHFVVKCVATLQCKKLSLLCRETTARGRFCCNNFYGTKCPCFISQQSQSPVTCLYIADFRNQVPLVGEWKGLPC